MVYVGPLRRSMSGKRFEYGCVSTLSQSREARITVIADVNTPAEPIKTGWSRWQRWEVSHAKADARDNAAMESFFGSLKEECVGNAIYPSHEQAHRGLFEYLEIYYNRIRRHSALGYVSPLVYEQLGKEQTKKNA